MGEPREAADRRDLRQPAREADVHEEQDDERRLGEGDQEHDDDVQRAEVDVRHRRRERRQDEERGEDDQVDPDRDDVLGVRHVRASVPPDQVEQREEEDPDDVDEVPVEPDELDRACSRPGRTRPRQRHRRTSHARMPRPMIMCSACRPVMREVEREEDLRVRAPRRPAQWKYGPGHQVLVELVRVLDALMPRKTDAEHDGERRGRRAACRARARSAPPRPRAPW